LIVAREGGSLGCSLALAIVILHRGQTATEHRANEYDAAT